MITKANMHLGFNCRDLDKSMWWYETFLGCHEKFTLYWGDMIPKNPEHLKGMDPERLAYLEKIKDEKWIVYMEFEDCPGSFVELFNEPDAQKSNTETEETENPDKQNAPETQAEEKQESQSLRSGSKILEKPKTNFGKQKFFDLKGRQVKVK